MTAILDFLVELYDNGASYSAINTARSAISSCVVIPGFESAGKHPLVKRLVKAVYQTRPSFPRYQKTWNVSQVLDYIRLLYPLNCLTLKDLTLKLVILIALVTGQRGQSIWLMDLQHMTEGKDSYRFLIQEKVKQSAPGRAQPELLLSGYPKDRKICVVKTMKEYLTRTKTLRTSTKLFISYIGQHKPASRDTISRWIKDIMVRAGIDVQRFAPHSTRSASVSRASSKNVPLNTILRTAGWSNQCTFAKFYNKDVEDTARFANAILDD